MLLVVSVFMAQSKVTGKGETHALENGRRFSGVQKNEVDFSIFSRDLK